MKKILFIIPIYLLVSCSGEQKKDEHSGHEQQAAEQATKYTCPMHPQVIQDGPGKCPICGMDLVTVSKSATADNTLMLSESQIKLANITTQKVMMRPVGQAVVVNGTLAVDEDRTEVISSRAAGRIEKLFTKEAGKVVTKGEVLYELYSETLLTLQREYLLAKEQYETLGTKEQRYASFLKAAERKLILYGLTQSQIEKLAQSKKVEDRISFVSPATGIVTEIGVAEGQYINEGTMLYQIENIGQLWVRAELYPNEMSWVKKGESVEVRVAGFENTPVETVINFLSPEYRANSQITVVRASISNPEMKFKPGMQAQVMFTHSIRKALAVPVDAVIRDGKGTHVYVQTDVNTFQPRMVKTGIEDFTQVEVLDGLMENEIVAVTGAYLLYSELILKKGSDPMAGHTH